MSLTGVNVPDIDIFNNVNQVAITAATNQIYNINSRKLRNIAAKYVPIEGMDMISKGLTVMHFTPNDNGDIKNKDQHVSLNYFQSFFSNVFTIYQPSLIIHLSCLIIHPSSLIIHQSSLIIHLPCFIIHPSSLIIHQSSLIIHLSCVIIQP